MSKPRVIYWFRTDLRLHDSPALMAALDLRPDCLYPIWTWDPHYVYRARVGSNRWQFLLDCQTNLSENITKLNAKSKLFVLREAPQTLFRKLFKQWKITHLVFEKDTDAYGRERDEKIMEIAAEMGVKVVTKAGRTLWDSEDLVKANGGKPTMSITQVQTAGEKLGAIAKPLAAPSSLPDPGDLTLDFEQEQPPQKPDFDDGFRAGEEKSYQVGLAGPDGDFSVPTMEELGLQEATTQHRGGETIALSILDKVIANEDFTATFSKPETAPTAFEPQSTCLTSPHLHFGSLSVRLFWYRVQEVLDSYKGTASQPPTSLHGQLLFRDMYFGAQCALGFAFSQTTLNPTCRFIPWHLPSKHDPGNNLIIGEYEINDPEKEQWFQRWKHGKTGFPFIDALMRQLRVEGWIHHLGRHMVACFLTRGGCYIHWERGAEVFEELLLDHETACNSGNWQWLACVAFYSQFYRCYSPIAFGRKWDKEGLFVKRYCPELEKLPAKYIYEPWKAPIADQRKAGIVVRGDGTGEAEEGGLKVYPKPMFDFAKRREICIQGLKGAYQVGLHGNDAKVLDGSWKSLFADDAEGVTEGSKGSDRGEGKKRKADEKTEGHDDIKHASPRTTRSNKREKGQATLENAFSKANK
ncbi:FAD binding domain of DNA photolyase-domain-containing protein [Delphinella strobiligena]|nr:FAD binding domain of DNA photolyase-domain-containing protein [Delphinella strobiligena]